MTSTITRRGFVTRAIAAATIGTIPTQSNAQAQNFADNFFASLPQSSCYKFRAHISGVTEAVKNLNNTLSLLCDQSPNGFMYGFLIKVRESQQHRSQAFRDFSAAYHALLQNGNNPQSTSLEQAGQSAIVLTQMQNLAQGISDRDSRNTLNTQQKQIWLATRDLGYYELQALARNPKFIEIVNHPLNDYRRSDKETFRRYQKSMEAIRIGRYDHHPDYRQELAFCSSFKTSTFLAEITSNMSRNDRNYNLVKNLQDRASAIYVSQQYIINPGRRYSQTCGTIFKAVSPN